MAETMNMKLIDIERFTQFVRRNFEMGNRRPIVGIGKSGVGKTESIAGLARDMGIGFCEIRLITMSEVDLLGVPLITEDKRTDFASNNLLPMVERDGIEGFLVLDEITSASQNIRTAAYQLLDSKRSLGNYKLPDKWLVLAFGNGPDDGGNFQGMEGAFLSRGYCFRIEADLRVWKKYAVKTGVHESVIAYLSFEPENLHSMTDTDFAQVFACPRSWVALSDLIKSYEAGNGGAMLDIEDVELLASCSVGSEIASKFAAFYSYVSGVASIDDIDKGEGDSNLFGVGPEVMYLTSQALVARVKELLSNPDSDGTHDSDSLKRVGNICNWLIDVGGNRSLDLAITAFNDIGANVPEFAKIIILDDEFVEKYCPRYDDFCMKNGIVVKM